MPGTAHRYEIQRPQPGDPGVIVTCPKNNKAMLDAKLENIGWAFWNFPRAPKRFEPGDLLYVVYDGAIRYAFETGNFDVARTKELPPVDDAEGHNPPLPKGGIRAWLNDYYEIDPPIPMRGFQGFRYTDPPTFKYKKRSA